MRTLSRDPFARTDTVRFTTPMYDRKPCDWCGSKPGRYQYATVTDSLRHNAATIRGAFCSKSCHDSFHG